MRWVSLSLAVALLSACAAPGVARVPQSASPSPAPEVAASTPQPTPKPTPRSALPPDLPTHCAGTPTGTPDRNCNPGVADPSVTQDNIAATICAPGYVSRVSPPGEYLIALRAQQLLAYGFDGDPENYDEDHVLAIGLGGDPHDPRNLWPQTLDGTAADRKDELEQWAQGQVCSGRMTLASAQVQMLGNWRAFYQVMLAAKARGDDAPAPTSSLVVSVTRSSYGTVIVRTRPGAQCLLRVLTPGGEHPLTLPQATADAGGVIVWTYPAPFATAVGTGTHTITCASGFEVSTTNAPFGVSTDTTPSA